MADVSVGGMAVGGGLVDAPVGVTVGGELVGAPVDVTVVSGTAVGPGGVGIGVGVQAAMKTSTRISKIS